MILISAVDGIVGLDAVLSYSSNITSVQLRLEPVYFTHSNSSRFLESFNDIVHGEGNLETASNLSFRSSV